MKRGRRAALAAMAVVIASAALGGCAGQSGRTASVASTTATPRSAVWQLRAGLNVAALTCRGRGRVSVASDYRRLMKRHGVLLNAAYRAEKSRRGRAFDHQQTRLYNHFSNQRSPAKFCKAASGIARQARSMSSASLSRASPHLVAELERGRR